MRDCPKENKCEYIIKAIIKFFQIRSSNDMSLSDAKL